MSNANFRGVIKRTVGESQPWWPEDKQFKAGTPNVVIVVFDDVGFAHFNNYGSSIDTPNLDKLAFGGLRFSNFHTTGLCSPTRACLLTGRNHHTVGMRAVSNFDTGFPHMRGAIPRTAATLAEILRDQGFGTHMAGKWHLAPMHETSPAGPFHNWPLARGFDRFYGFLQGETDQFRPELVHDNHYTEPPGTPEQGYHVTEDLIDKAINFARDHISAAPNRPFFSYLAFGACHAPHQAPASFLEKYRGRFDEGWDVLREQCFERQKKLGIIPENTTLPPRNAGVPVWSELSRDEQVLSARLQEAFAAFLDHTDHHLGRYVDALSQMGQLDNTLFIVMSDNGASQEGGRLGTLDGMRYYNGLPDDMAHSMSRLHTIGGPDSHTNFAWGWAMLGNTPLKRYKQETYAGGVRDPLIIHWPERIHDQGAIRRQFHHVTDIVPTILELLDIEAPTLVNGIPQLPIHGTSLAYTLKDGASNVPSPKGPQYFEMLGHRAIWHDGWKAICDHKTGADYDSEDWELYRAQEDASEAHDLSQQYPQRLAELVALWWIEAEKYGVFPLDDRSAIKLFKTSQMRGKAQRRNLYVYFPPISRHSAEVAPGIGSRSFSISADLTLGSKREGAIFARGSANGGYVLFVQDGRLVFDHNYFHQHTQIRSDVPLPNGPCVAGVRVERSGKRGLATLFVGESDVGSIDIPEMASMVSSTGMDVGRSSAPVSHDYASPFVFDGELRSVTVSIAESGPSTARSDALIAERATAGLQ